MSSTAIVIKVPLISNMIMKMANGFNPPVMYPIGWSSDGKIAMLDVESIGYGGAVSTHIIVEDLSNDEEIETLDVSLTGSPELGSDLVYDHNGNSDLVWLEEDFVNAVADIIEKHKIIPLGFGQLEPIKSYWKDLGLLVLIFT